MDKNSPSNPTDLSQNGIVPGGGWWKWANCLVQRVAQELREASSRGCLAALKAPAGCGV